MSKATDPKGKEEGAVPSDTTVVKKPEEPPKTTDSKGKAEEAVSSTPAEAKKPEKSTRTPTPKVEIVSNITRKAATSQDEIPPDFSLTIVPNDKLGTVAMMPIDLIDDFEGHPFEVRDDADMKELVASIKQVGLLEPATVIRNERKIGRFEMVAGHRRKHAAKLAGLTHMSLDIHAHQMHMGIMFEERRRARPSKLKLFVNRYPLVEMGWTRPMCYAYNREVLGIQTRASCCLFCPFHTNYFYQHIRTHEPSCYACARKIDELVESRQAKPPLKSKLFLSKSLKRLRDLTAEDCQDAQTFLYYDKTVWSGF